jgi:hypothetical protein
MRPRPHCPPRGFLLGQLVADPLPDLEAALIAARGDFLGSATSARLAVMS